MVLSETQLRLASKAGCHHQGERAGPTRVTHRDWGSAQAARDRAGASPAEPTPRDSRWWLLETGDVDGGQGPSGAPRDLRAPFPHLCTGLAETACPFLPGSPCAGLSGALRPHRRLGWPMGWRQAFLPSLSAPTLLRCGGSAWPCPAWRQVCPLLSSHPRATKGRGRQA